MKRFSTYIIAILFPLSFMAQNEESGNFFIGINAGGFFANKNTAIMYTGGQVALRGIDYYFPLEFGQTALYDNYSADIRDYFDYDYKIENDGLPAAPAYRPAIDIGIHTGIKLGGGNAIFMDLNTARLKFEQYFSVTVQNPTGTPQIAYEQIPLFGEESRMNINLGGQISFYNEESINTYFSLFGNFNSARLQKNYFVLNNKQYTITHRSIGLNQQNPGGNGFGGGGGIGTNIKFNDQFTFGAAYNLIYSKTRMNDSFAPFGIHHSLALRVIWG